MGGRIETRGTSAVCAVWPDSVCVCVGVLGEEEERGWVSVVRVGTVWCSADYCNLVCYVTLCFVMMQ